MRSITTLSGLLLCGLLAIGTSAETPGPEELVRDATTHVLEALRADPELMKDNARLYDLVDQAVLPHFDFARMSQRVLGKYWRSASEEQRQRFVEQFKRLLVNTYAHALAEYRDEDVKFLPSRARSDDDTSVRTEVGQSGAPPIPITYEMYRTDGGWQAYDVSIDGVSLVINYRSTFSTEIRRNGIDGLIGRLDRHNAGRKSTAE
jgi:phospholipid transport system substrate-binding protein